MRKIILDTNVIVSALIQQSYPYLILNDFIVYKKFQLCISDELMSEYYEVLCRPKFSRFRDFFFKAEAVLAQIELRAIKYKPTLNLHIISDIDDNMILELADKCAADFVITGNTTDFTFPMYKNTQIITPKNYWENHKTY